MEVEASAASRTALAAGPRYAPGELSTRCVRTATAVAGPSRRGGERGGGGAFPSPPPFPVSNDDEEKRRGANISAHAAGELIWARAARASASRARCCC